MKSKKFVTYVKTKKKLSKTDERFRKSFDKNSHIFLKQVFSNQEICLFFIATYHFYLKERKSKNVISLFVTFMRRKTMLFT